MADDNLAGALSRAEEKLKQVEDALEGLADELEEAAHLADTAAEEAEERIEEMTGQLGLTEAVAQCASDYLTTDGETRKVYLRRLIGALRLWEEQDGTSAVALAFPGVSAEGFLGMTWDVVPRGGV